jgi:hypothetical protein
MFGNKSQLYLDFKQDYINTNLAPARKLAIFATLLYLLFSLLDVYLVTSEVALMVITRISITVILVLILALTYSESLKRYWQQIFSLFIIGAGIGVIILSSYLTSPIKTLYSQGLLFLWSNKLGDIFSLIIDKTR